MWMTTLSVFLMISAHTWCTFKVSFNDWSLPSWSLSLLSVSYSKTRLITWDSRCQLLGWQPLLTKLKPSKHWSLQRLNLKFEPFWGFVIIIVRRFVKGYADISRCLTQLTHQDVSWNWTAAHAKAFETLKQRLSEPPILRHPDFIPKSLSCTRMPLNQGCHENVFYL